MSVVGGSLRAEARPRVLLTSLLQGVKTMGLAI